MEQAIVDFGNGETYVATPANPFIQSQKLRLYFRGNYVAVCYGGSTLAWVGTYTPAPARPYTLIYTDANGNSQSYDVGKNGQPPHWWNARWRTTIPLNIKNTIQQLRALDLVPNYRDLSPNDPPPKPPSNYVYNFPMDTGGVVVQEGTTGERPDIGGFNEADAYAVMTGNFGPSYAYNLGLNSTDFFLIDEATGKFWDFIKYPLLSTYDTAYQNGDKTKPWYIVRWSEQPQKQIQWDNGHNPEAGYLLSLVTGDPYWLELVQANAQMALIFTNSRYGLEMPDTKTFSAGNGYVTWTVGQGRGYSFSGRNIILAYLATKFFEDNGYDLGMCLPSSIYLQQIKNQIAAVKQLWMAGDCAKQFHRSHPMLGGNGCWHQDKLPLAFAALHIPEIKEYAEWNFGNLWFRVNGRNGWPPSVPGPYFVYYMPNIPVRLGGTLGVRPDARVIDPRKLVASDWLPDAKAVTDYLGNQIITNNGDALITPAQWAQVTKDQWNGHNWLLAATFDHFIARNNFAEYIYAMRKGKIDLSQYASVAEIEQAYANQEAMMVNYEKIGDIPARQSVDIDPIVPADFTIQPNSPPPPTGVSMTTSTSLKVGETKVLPITVTPAGADLSSLTLKTSPAGIVSVSLVKDASGYPTGVSATGVAKGSAQIIGDVNGEDANGVPAVVEAICNVAVAAPLARSLAIG